MPLQPLPHMMGAPAQVASILANFGRDVTLEDGTIVRGVLWEQQVVDTTAGRNRVITVYTLRVPTDAAGTLAADQRVTVDEDAYYVQGKTDQAGGYLGWTHWDVTRIYSSGQ